MKSAEKLLQLRLRQSPWTNRQDWVLKFRQYHGYTYAYLWHEKDGEWGTIFDNKGHRWYGTSLGRYKDGYVGVHSEVAL